MKRFLYLVQSRDGCLPAPYEALNSEDSDRLILTWGSPSPNHLHLPRSTWTQGRNRLLAEARSPGRPDYLYYIFLDDDLILRQGTWREFERQLLAYEPAVATPYCRDYRQGFLSPGLDVQRCFQFDAMCNAFHREVIQDEIVLPYYPGLDEQSWWFSQWFVTELALLLYPRHVLQINTVHVENRHHGEYPQARDLETARAWFYGEVIRVWSYAWRQWLPHARVVDLRWRWRRRKWRDDLRFRPPERRHGSYRVSPKRQHHLFNPEAAFWGKRL